ncbi:MAG TPA: bifunctional adenosylcobinamide kinase/adenosylcobinamide-phosphate guanylyltransferase [Acidimicrobiales bacterium]|jgi:adenosylcobinamide kinase/adenosylcobinamide-phosphate guanylyltransferase|nr:bifunctional adenosylcobinamide kinase/adenosylcobinamide-phosphate guanylyltransferase [Acidimicrobiales bacterium]
MITLVLGGARSGKSGFAERLAAESGGPVTYVATASVVGDPDFDERVRRHRARRPVDWVTAEPGQDLVSWLSRDDGAGTVLVDSLGTWVAGATDFHVDVAGLCQALVRRGGPAVLVSDEVGLGVHPSTGVGGRFRDALGEANQAVSAVADRVFLVVAGRLLTLGEVI